MADNEIDREGGDASLADLSPVEMEDEGGSIDLVAAFQKLFRNRKTLVRITSAVFIVAVAISYLLPTRYTSEVSFIPPTLAGNTSMAAMIGGQLSAMGGSQLLGAGKTSGDLYAGILSSRSVTSDLVKRFHLLEYYKVKKESQAEKDLAANTSISVDLKSTIVTVDVTDKSPDRAHDMADAYMDALREANGRLALGESSQRRLFFDQQLAKEKDDLEDAEVDLKKTEETSGLIAPAGQTATEISTIAQTQAQIAFREVQLAALRDSATEQNPEVIRLKSEIGDLQGQLARLQHGSDQASASSIPTSKVPELELEYVRKEREVKYHEALFDMLSRQYEAARLDESRDAPVLQVLDSASYPDTKSSPKRSLIMLGGLLLGFFVSCVWVLSRERLMELRAALREGPQA